MKKIFWTSVFWFLVVFLFRSYVRLFDTPLVQKVGLRFGISPKVCVTGTVSTGFTQEFDLIKTQLDLINKKLSSEPVSSSPISLFETTVPTKVALYYFNQIEDQKLPPGQQINITSLLPVYRMFPASKDLLIATIDELLKGKLTPSEIQQGFVSDFPHPEFVLLSSNLASNGLLTLEFSSVPGFTDGGSARMLILSNLIKKTVLQFAGVKKVVFLPETLFQP